MIEGSNPLESLENEPPILDEAIKLLGPISIMKGEVAHKKVKLMHSNMHWSMHVQPKVGDPLIILKITSYIPLNLRNPLTHLHHWNPHVFPTQLRSMSQISDYHKLITLF